MGEDKDGKATSFGDAVLASGKPERFDHLIEKYRVKAVHNVVYQHWRSTPEERALAAAVRRDRATKAASLTIRDGRASERQFRPRAFSAKGKGKPPLAIGDAPKPRAHSSRRRK